MKKTLLSMLMFASCFSVVNAQLMVDENGRIGMNIDTTESLYFQRLLHLKHVMKVVNYNNATNKDICYEKSNSSFIRTNISVGCFGSREG